MKIFDFTNGSKGKLLAETGILSATGGWNTGKNGKTFKVTLANEREGWAWASTAHVKDKKLDPADFGVGAICCCWGQTTHDQVWNWVVVGTPEWNREACKSGILKAEVIK